MALAWDDEAGLEAAVGHLAAGRAFTLQLLDAGPGVTLADLLHRPQWHADAACREHPTVNFFPGEVAADRTG